MLKRLGIQNFRCFRSLKVDLRPLTVLIGPNDSGKSSFLTALDRLANATKFAAADHWALEPRQLIQILGLSGAGPVEVGFIPDRGFSRDFQPRGKRARDPTQPTILFELPASGVSMESVGYGDQGQPPSLASTGALVPALVDHLLRRERKRFDDFVSTMRARVPGLKDVHVATPSPERRRIDIEIEDGLVMPADEASAGVRLLLFFVALSYHPDPPKVILLEEPENGVHPKRLADIMKLLREITKGVHCGHPAQVILTTHSPYLLDHVDLDKDQVLVFRRNDDGSRTAKAVDAERLKTFLDDFMLGEVWFNEQEEGLLKRGD